VAQRSSTDPLTLTPRESGGIGNVSTPRPTRRFAWSYHRASGAQGSEDRSGRSSPATAQVG
jgi:hypothetical protein